MNPDHGISSFGVSTQDNTDIVQIADVLRRFKWTLAFWIILFVFLGTYYTFSVLLPKYTATTVVMLQASRSNIVDFESVAPELAADFWSISTEVEVMRARNLLAKVIDKEGLIDDPEFNPFLRAELAKQENPDGTLLSQAMAKLFGESAPSPPPPPERIRNATIDSFLRSVSVENIKGTRAFNIHVTTLDPKKSAHLADALAEAYILNQLEGKFSATQQATAWLTDRVAQLKFDLEESEASFKALNAEVDLVSAEMLEGLNRQLKGYRVRAAGFAEQIELLEARVEKLEAAGATGDTKQMVEAAGDQSLRELSQRLPGASDDLRATFYQRFEQITERARMEATRAVSQFVALESSIADLEVLIDRQSADLVRLEQLQREAEANKVIYEYFLGRLRETSVQQGIQQADSTILSNAVEPLFPSSPRKALILVISFVLGVLAGLTHTALKQMKARDFRSSKDVVQFTGLRVIGRIPKEAASRPSRLLRYLREKPASAFAEMIRDLRTSIMLSNVDKPPQVIMFASSTSGEGKTTQSVALAASYVTMPKKVLLVDCDLRRRTVGTFFDLPETGGLVSAVIGNGVVEQAIHHDLESGIHIMPADSAKVNPADFFASSRFHQFLERMRHVYDVILLDTPPILVVPEARLIAQHADCVVYSVRWGKTLKRMVRQGVDLLRDANVAIAGITLNMIDQREAARYGEYQGSYDRKYHVK